MLGGTTGSRAGEQNLYWTADMARRLPEDGNRYEVVYGELLVTPAPRLWHQRLVLRLASALEEYLARHPSAGVAFTSPADISWGSDVLVQPDVFVVPAEQARALDWSAVHDLLLVAEVLSPSTPRHDRFTKRRRYQEAGVPLYWIIDGDERQVEVWTPATRFLASSETGSSGSRRAPALRSPFRFRSFSGQSGEAVTPGFAWLEFRRHDHISDQPPGPVQRPRVSRAPARRHRAARTDRRRPRAPGRGARRRPAPPARRRRPRLHPDAKARRQLVKATIRQRKAARVRRRRRRSRHRDPDAPPADGLHHAERLPARRFEQREAAGDPDFREPLEPQHCYVCKQHYTAIHHFYDQLCPPAPSSTSPSAPSWPTCAAGWRCSPAAGSRSATRPGSSCSAPAHGSSSPRASPATRRPATPREPDFGEWGDRLEIFGLDLRHTPSVEAFCRELLATRDRLDFIVNNACQTVRRPPEFYEHMMEGETDGRSRHARARAQAARPLRGAARRAPASRRHRRTGHGRHARGLERRLPSIAGLIHAAELSQVPLLPEEREPQQASLPRGPARPGPAAGGPARAQLLAAAAGRGAVGGAAGGAAGQRRRALHPQRAAQAADAAHARAATSTSSTSRRWRGSSTATSRRRAIRTPTWPRPRST